MIVFSTNIYVIYKSNIGIVPSNTTAANRSNHPEVFLRKVVLKICCKFTGEHLCQGAISLRHGCSLINLLIIFRTPFPENTFENLIRTMNDIARGSLSFYVKSWAYKFTKRCSQVSSKNIYSDHLYNKPEDKQL